MICFNLLVLRMYVLHMEFDKCIQSCKSSFLEHHMSFHIFKVQFYNESRNLYEYLGTEISNKLVHPGLALCSNLVWFVLGFLFLHSTFTY